MTNCEVLYDDLYLLIYSYLKQNDKLSYGYVSKNFYIFLDADIKTTKNKLNEKLIQYIHNGILRSAIQFRKFIFDLDDYLLLKRYFLLYKYYTQLTNL